MKDLLDPGRKQREAAERRLSEQSKALEEQEKKQKTRVVREQDKAKRAAFVPSGGRRSLIKTSATGQAKGLGG